MLADDGWRILARNVRTRACELDIVALRRDLLIAVEVKARTSHGAPERIVDDRLLARLRQSLRLVAQVFAPRATRLRVDVVAAIPTGATFELSRFETAEFAP
jgi:putative endonuclease